MSVDGLIGYVMGGYGAVVRDLRVREVDSDGEVMYYSVCEVYSINS